MSLISGVKFAPRGELCPLGVMFTPSFTPSGEPTLLLRRMKGLTNDLHPWGGGNFKPRRQRHPWGKSSPLGVD
jgi:hypothetical protein